MQQTRQHKPTRKILAFLLAFAACVGVGALYQSSAAQSKTGLTRLSKSSFRLDNDAEFVKLSKGRGEVRRLSKRLAGITCKCTNTAGVECNLTRDGRTLMCASACTENIACEGEESPQP